MAKTKYEKELEKRNLVQLARICDRMGVPHTGNREELIARLVEAEQVEHEPEPPAEPPAEPGENPPAEE